MQCGIGRSIALALLLHVTALQRAHVRALGTKQPCDDQKVPAQATVALGQTRRPLNAAEDCAATCRHAMAASRLMDQASLQPDVASDDMQIRLLLTNQNMTHPAGSMSGATPGSGARRTRAAAGTGSHGGRCRPASACCCGRRLLRGCRRTAKLQRRSHSQALLLGIS
jgi:hypothetical protein